VRAYEDDCYFRRHDECQTRGVKITVCGLCVGSLGEVVVGEGGALVGGYIVDEVYTGCLAPRRGVGVMM
jgi:hypothetical protein